MRDNAAGSIGNDQPLSTSQYSLKENPSTRVQLELNPVNGSTLDEVAAAAEAMEAGRASTTVCVTTHGPESETHVSNYRKVAAEAIATFFLVFLGCGSIIGDKKSQGSVTLLGISFAFGLAIMAMVRAVGHISGAHMNPAVTIAFASVREFPLYLVPFYIVAQVGGGICAGYVLRLLFDYDLDEDVSHLGTAFPKHSDLQALGMEFLITFALMFVVASVAVDSKNVGELAGLILGLTITLLAIVGIPVSGGSMNPARSIGPAVAANSYKSLWVYIVGPIVGAVAGAWVYALVHGPQNLPAESHVRLKSNDHRRRFQFGRKQRDPRHQHHPRHPH